MAVGTNGSGRKRLRFRPATIPVAPVADNDLVWDEGCCAADNYRALGERLAESGDLFRRSAYDGGLLLVLPDGGHRRITRATELAAIIVDRVRIWISKDADRKGGSLPAGHLNAMLQSMSFLRQFTPVDQATQVPLYLRDFTLVKPGYNDGGEGYRIYYAGPEVLVSDSLDTINKFLEIMDFQTNADRTNAVAAALTVTLRNHWPGGKPIVLATATKSHAGKDTIIAFATGPARSVSISYQGTNWAFERSFVGALKSNPDAAMVVIENARLDRRDRCIASAFLERTATDPEPFLFSTGTGAPVRIRNDIVLAISTNFGTVSEDILNRSLPIHLHPVGDVASRRSPIGNPRYEYLPANAEQIAAELRGMVERWKAAGQPLDEKVQHSFIQWAKTVGGILKVNGFTDFLGNYGVRRTSDDPVREALGLLGAYEFRDATAGEACGEWRRAGEWAEFAGELGLTRTLVPERDREKAASRSRALGIVLSVHAEETFTAEDESRVLTLRLEKSRHRENGDEAKVYYRFVLVGAEPLPEDSAPDAAVVAVEHVPEGTAES